MPPMLEGIGVDDALDDLIADPRHAGAGDAQDPGDGPQFEDQEDLDGEVANEPRELERLTEGVADPLPGQEPFPAI